MPSKEYWAGFFDGEGSVSIQKRLTVQVVIGQKKEEILHLAKEQFGGNISGSKAANWKLCKGSEIINFLEAILPYSIGKKEEIEIGLEVVRGYRHENKGCHPLSIVERDRRYNLRLRLQKLRPKRTFQDTTSERIRKRNAIKEQFNNECCECGIKVDKPFDAIVSDNQLFCRKCNRLRYDIRPKKVIPKELVERALEKYSELPEIAKFLGISRSYLYKLRKFYGLRMRKKAKINNAGGGATPSLVNY